MAQYKIGTVTIVDGDKTVIGTNTLWKSKITEGNLFKINGEDTIYIVDSVTSDTELELTTPYSGNQTLASYVIVISMTANFKVPVINKGDASWPIFVKHAFDKFDWVYYEPESSSSESDSSWSTSYAYNRGNLSFARKLPETGDIYGTVKGLQAVADVPTRLLTQGLMVFEIGPTYSLQRPRYYDGSSWQTFATETPVITDVTPDEDLDATQQIKITGNYLGGNQGDSTITVNGVDAGRAVIWQFTTAPESEIVVKVPGGSSSGNVIVTVKGNASNGYPVTFS